MREPFARRCHFFSKLSDSYWNNSAFAELYMGTAASTFSLFSTLKLRVGVEAGLLVSLYTFLGCVDFVIGAVSALRYDYYFVW